MNSVVFNVIAFLIEITKAVLISEFVFKIETDKKLRLIVGIIISTIMVAGISIYYNVYDFSFVCVIIATIITFWNITYKKNIVLVCLLYVGISILDMIMGSLIMMLFNINANAFVKNNWMFLPVNCISLCILLGVVYYKKKIELSNIRISKGCAILLISSGICLGIYISVLQAISYNSTQNRQIKIAVMILSVVSVTFIIVAATLIIKDNRNEQLMREAEINTQLLKLQEEYYIMQLQKDEETKKIRHDIKNHFCCMQILLKDKEYEELNQYISKIYTNITNLESNINTGNKLVDAIVTNLHKKYEGINLEWKGQLPDNIKLSAMDVCTIFSNLLSNAFEATYKTQNKQIDVLIKVLESQLFITISNQFNGITNIVKGKLMTTKKEKNHGYGLENAQKCVEENNGILEKNILDNIFKVEILFYDIYD